MRLSSYCTKRCDNAVNLITSRKTNARLVRPIENASIHPCFNLCKYVYKKIIFADDVQHSSTVLVRYF